MSSISEADSVSKGVTGGDQSDLSLENYLQNDNPKVTQNLDSGMSVIKEYQGIKRDNSSCDSDDEEEDYSEDDGSVFRRFYFESDHLAFKHNRE